jgi:predicted dehydrogenase
MSNFPILNLLGVADLNPAMAEEKSAEFGVPARSIDDVLADPDIEIIVNLTIPKAHVEIATRTLEAGKHAYSEKPLALIYDEGKTLLALAAAKGLRVGAAPDTFLGGSHQVVRALIDEGVIGVPVGGTAVFMRPGHERWHPNPDFYYDIGGGPMLDMGPYYLTQLVNCFGSITQVAGFATMPRSERIITSEPRNGERIAVHVPTHITGSAMFENGAVVQICMSFDVAAHKHEPIELYGTDATLIVPDPNFFGGEVQLCKKDGDFTTLEASTPYSDGEFRSIGIADMAHAIRSDRPHRANGTLALHVLEVMEAFQSASDSGATIQIESRAERPAPLAESCDNGRLAS